MNTKLTIFNWKWWIILIPVVFVFLVISIPNVIVFTLDRLIYLVELVNIGNRRGFKFTQRIVDWVQKK